MKWLEVIKLRSAGGKLELLDELLRPLSGSNQRGLVEMKTFRHSVLETDGSIHLHWNSEMPEINGSALGLRLAQALKELGLVDHSVWIGEKKS